MRKETKLISEIQGNKANPRQIKDCKFEKLVDSLLVFPEMLELRPIVCNTENIVLGGNMRVSALAFIAGMQEPEILHRLESLSDYQSKTTEQKNKVVDFWARFLDKPQIDVSIADNLSDSQQREFIIKDNASFGEWDWDALANEWDSVQLDDWGIDVWQMPDDIDESTDQEPAKQKEDEKDLSDKIQTQYKIEILCESESEQEELFNKLSEEGYECRILTL